MRILMLNNEFPPLGGGTGIVNYYLLQEMSGYKDLHVDLVTASRTRSEYEVEQFSPRITIYKVPVDNRNIHHSRNRELIKYLFRGLFSSLKLLRKYRYDLSFAFASVPAGGISYLLKKFYGLPYVVSLQGPDVPGFEARYNYLYPFLKPVIRSIWINAAVVTAISKEHRRLAKETMPDLEIPIVFNGVCSEMFRATDSRKDGPAVVRILCVGRLIERKGQKHLLRAFSNARRRFTKAVELVLVGTGDAEEALRRLTMELGIENAVTFAGYIPQERMPEIYRQADIFVLPSQNEGMSIALLEAMASGLPVVVTETGGAEELVCDGVNGRIVHWSDVNELESALTLLVHNDELRTEMGKASRNTALSFRWSNITSDYVTFCERIIGAHGKIFEDKSAVKNSAPSSFV